MSIEGVVTGDVVAGNQISLLLTMNQRVIGDGITWSSPRENLRGAHDLRHHPELPLEGSRPLVGFHLEVLGLFENPTYNPATIVLQDSGRPVLMC